MTGLEKILEKINTDSGLLCSEIEARAAKECEKIAAASQEKGKAIAAEAEKKAKADGETVIRMAQSAASQISRQTILAAKVEAVNETLDKLLDTLRDIPAEKYFPAIIKLAAENAIDCGYAQGTFAVHKCLPANEEEIAYFHAPRVDFSRSSL